MPKISDGRIALVALIALAAWLLIVLPLLYLPSEGHVHGEILGVKYGEWLLFAATMGLWWATWRLVRSAEKTAERQLRAYVLVTNITVSGVATDATPTADIIIRNSGQTPAYDVEVCIAVGLIDYPPTSGPGDDDGEVVGSVVVLGPQSEFRVPGQLIGQLSFSQYLAINSGAQAIHIIGEIKYRDAFGIARHTNFSSFYGGEFGTNDVGAPTHARTGNEAT